VRPEPNEVRAARDFCVRHVTAMVAADAAGAEFVDDAAMVTSELVTNALRAGAARIRLQLGTDDTVLRIGVRDDATGTVESTQTDPLALDGRGLRIVDMLADRWGVDELPTGKLVWADLSLPLAEQVERSGPER
jgi:anti-sigma regulatory factor (Ser/Thr protein kinase)